MRNATRARGGLLAIVAFSAGIACEFSCNACLASLVPGVGQFTWDDSSGRSDPDKPLKVHYFRPATVTAETPVWFILHGTSRNADDYRDYFAAKAAAQGAIILAPEFTESAWPGSRSYNLGNVSISESNHTPRNQYEWSFSKIEPLFDYLKDVLEPTVEVPEYFMFGHSAGAQFVHRFLQWTPEARVKLAISANAGWYTMAQYEDAGYPHAWPYSLTDVPDFVPSTPAYDAYPGALLDSYLSRKLVVLLGEADTGLDDDLRQSDEANAQGPHRFARGQYFFEQAEAEALSRGVDFGWQLQTVPGVAHSASQLSVPAAEIFRLANLSPADFNEDGAVDADDLVKWSEFYGLNSAADADGDGDSDGNDFLIWQRELNGNSAVPATVGIPEPTGIVQILVLAMCLIGMSSYLSN